MVSLRIVVIIKHLAIRFCLWFTRKALGGRHIVQRLVVPAEVVVFDEVGDSPLQLAREFIRDLVHFPLDGLVVALQFPVGLRMEGRSQDMSDANEVQIVPKGSGDIAGTVVRNTPKCVV